jgi:hypothetical protein
MLPSDVRLRLARASKPENYDRLVLEVAEWRQLAAELPTRRQRLAALERAAEGRERAAAG